MGEKKEIVGILWMVFHCFMISVLSAMVKVLSKDYHIFQIIFLYNFFAFILLFPLLYRSGIKRSLKTQKYKLHLVRGVLGVTSLACYFYGFTQIPLSEARAIALSGPLVSSLFAVLFLNEKIGIYRSSALVVGLLGAVIILQPGSGSFSYASLYIIIAVCFWSFIDIIIKILSKSEGTLAQLFYLTGLMSLFSLPFAIYVWHPLGGYIECLWFFALGLVFLINTMAVFKAIKNADITTIMPFDFMGMVFTALLAYFLFAEIVTITTLLGSIIIVASSVYIARRESIKSKKI